MPDQENQDTRTIGRLAIPFIGPKNNVYYMKYRCIEPHDCGEMDHGKYINMPGRLRPYNVRALTAQTDYLFVTEGELDAATLEACGWPAVGIGGANDWKPHYPRMLHGFRRVVLIADGDDKGRKLADKFLDTMPSGSRVIVSASGQDVNSLYQAGGKAALEQLIRGGK